MSQSKPAPVPLCELTPGQHADFFALLVEKVKGATRDGKPFYTVRFRDAHRTATFMVWSDAKWFVPCENEWREGQFYKLRATYGEHERYGPQIELENLRPVRDEDRADGFDPAAFVARSRLHPEAAFLELRGLIEDNIADEPLRRLVLTLLDRHAVALQRLPASQGRFYPFVGGLIEHVLSVTKTCQYLADRYGPYYTELQPPLNRDLLLAGAALHDLGRVLEFGDDVLATQQTVAGRLFGHLFLGRDLVRDAAREQGDVHPELVQMLEHLVISHLNHPEWGSPRLPLIPEAILLHHADDLDAKLEMYVRCLTQDRAAGPFTDRDPGLHRQLYKGRTV
jgi:3'-5' exoribonuclease